MTLYEIYFSPTGATKRAADAVAQAFDWEKKEIDLCDAAADFSQYDMSAQDVCLVAVPAYGGRVPQTALDRLHEIAVHGARAILLAAYGNRAYDDTLLELQDTLEEIGFSCAAAVAAVTEHSILRQFATGRPDAADCAELTAFGRKICERLTSGQPCGALRVPGGKPYRKYDGVPFKPKAGKPCTACGLCAERCPVQAIPADDPASTDTERCISCMRCIAICPQQARKVNPVVLAVGAQKLKKVCSVRKENELILPESGEG